MNLPIKSHHCRTLEEWLTMPMETGFKCPGCGRVSYNPTDLAQRYCGDCHRWWDKQDQWDERVIMTEKTLEQLRAEMPNWSQIELVEHWKQKAAEKFAEAMTYPVGSSSRKILLTQFLIIKQCAGELAALKKSDDMDHECG